MTKTMSIRMDEENFDFLNKLSQEETGDVSKAVRELINKGRLMLAVERYKKNQASLGRAAELAGLTLGDMINTLAEFGVKSNLEAGVPRLAISACAGGRVEPGANVQGAGRRRLVGRIWIVGRVDRLLSGEGAGGVQGRKGCRGSAPPTWTRLRLRPQLVSSRAAQGMGSGRAAKSRSMTSTRCRIVSVGSWGRRQRPIRR